MSCLQIDYITPKHSSKVHIQGAAVMPISSSCDYVSNTNGVSITVTYNTTGNLCTLVTPQFTFTGANEAFLSFYAVSPTALIPISLETVVRIPVPVFIDDALNLGVVEITKVPGSPELSYISTYAAIDRAMRFTTGTPCSVSQCVLNYTTV